MICWSNVAYDHLACVLLEFGNLYEKIQSCLCTGYRLCLYLTRVLFIGGNLPRVEITVKMKRFQQQIDVLDA